MAQSENHPATNTPTNWRPIETALRDGTPIHLGFLHMAGFDVIAHWSDGDWSLAGDGRHAVRLHGRPAPSHWRPLPPPPSDRDELSVLRDRVASWKCRVCESELLRDPALTGQARAILTEIANHD